MPLMQMIPNDDPLMIAWNAYKTTEDYANTRKHAFGGSLWAAFMAGFQAATERAAALHEAVNPACDHERGHDTPGAGAMGAVIEYRDRIRARSPSLPTAGEG